jgi:hypothetical protein
MTTGWTRGMMRCGRYGYREVAVHTTNPDHLIHHEPSTANTPPLRIVARYAVAPSRASRRFPAL